MEERNGVRVGQRVRDLDGAPLGRVVRLFEEGFQVRRGLPVLVKREHVVRYDEVRGVRDGALVVARGSRDLLDLAAGGLPPSWRIPAPPAFPTAATPAEARDLLAAIARGDVPGAALEDPFAAPAADASAPERAERAEEVTQVTPGGHGAAPPHR